MIYMVEMDFRNPAREADWHVWYLDHVTKLIRNVPGFRATQRFRAITATLSPWLALHDVVSPAVFESKEYRGNGGPNDCIGEDDWLRRPLRQKSAMRARLAGNTNGFALRALE